MLSSSGTDNAEGIVILLHSADHTENTCHVRLRVYWPINRAGCSADDIENIASSIVA
jgi:hypothetical protein